MQVYHECEIVLYLDINRLKDIVRFEGGYRAHYKLVCMDTLVLLGKKIEKRDTSLVGDTLAFLDESNTK